MINDNHKGCCGFGCFRFWFSFYTILILIGLGFYISGEILYNDELD